MALQGGFSANTSAPRDGSVSDAVAQFDPIIKRLDETRAQLEQTLSRVFGPHPTAVPESQIDEAPPPSLIGQINKRAQILSRLVEHANELARRLDAVL